MREQVDSPTLRFLIPTGLAVLFFAMIVMIVTTTLGSDPAPNSASSLDAITRKLPLYWTVRNGQTYSQIAEKTGLTVDQLMTFNPTTDPSSIVPGQRLKLRLHMPPPRPKPLGPRFWIVKSGDSFGSIAAKTGKNIIRLQQLNRRLKAEALQPGDRVRLRPDGRRR
ncbi:MAG: LysM peptidoglycan-binding domain-containing protein [Actinobacteria bacterium]|jgi:LysM repeat protein|nr:LysM peptidoglycan-binding domain-containing protein [Actinomycetota bacterium]